MAILIETKEQLTKQFGVPAKAHVLVGGDELFTAEEASRFTLGRFLVTVGFHGGIARYASFAKDPTDNPSFDDRDIEVCLALIAPDSSWRAFERDSGTPGSEAEPKAAGASWVVAEYKTTIKDARGNNIVVIACHRTIKPYFLAYTPKASPESAAGAEKLDKLLADLNTAPAPEARIDAIVAVINELAAQHKALLRERRDD